MNPEQILAHLKRLTSTLSVGQLASLGVAFLGVVAVTVGSAYWINQPTYSVLFGNLDGESAQAIVSKLKTDKVQYVLDDGGRTVRVPSDRIDDLRLEFSSQSSLPISGRIGFEIFDRTAFGTTDFLEKVNYRRAIEGELARTISTLDDIASARVHISLANKSLFASEAEPAKASIVVKLRDKKRLSQGTVSAVTGLVAAAVESLRPEGVVILDTMGRGLTPQPGDNDDPSSGLKLNTQQKLERDLTAKVIAALEPVVGVGRARVNVTALLEGNSEEETEEKWDPAPVMRKQSKQSDSTGVLGAATLTTGVGGAAAGVPGARSNTPGNSSTAAETTQTSVTPGQQSSTHTADATDYEVGKLTRHRLIPPGSVKHLAVAVLLDNVRTTAKDAKGVVQVTTKPRDPAELKQLQELVATSVGLNADHGDVVTLVNVPFNEEEPDAPADAPTLLQRVVPMVKSGGAVYEIGRIVAIVGLALFTLLMILRPMARNALQLPPALQASSPLLVAGQPGRTVADLESQIEADLDGSTGQLPHRLGALTKRLSKAAEKEPENVARLVRSLLTEGDR